MSTMAYRTDSMAVLPSHSGQSYGGVRRNSFRNFRDPCNETTSLLTSVNGSRAHLRLYCSIDR